MQVTRKRSCMRITRCKHVNGTASRILRSKQLQDNLHFIQDRTAKTTNKPNDRYAYVRKIGSTRDPMTLTPPYWRKSDMIVAMEMWKMGKL